MKVFVHQVKPDSPYFLAIQNAMHWFWERGYELVPFSLQEVQEGTVEAMVRSSPNDSIVRAVPEVVRLLLKRLASQNRLCLTYQLLTPWIGRFTWETTLGQVREQVHSEISFNPFHIRPLDHRRLFKGTVVYGLRDLIPSASLADQTPVLAQQKVEFKSEWRAFLLRDKILHVAHVKGDPLLFPDRELMISASDAYTGRPIAFGMDWGITPAGQTMLIEVNDGYSLGNYGMHGMMHTAMIEARWRELMDLPDNGIGECFTR